MEHPIWAYDCPQRVREHAFVDACAAVKNAKIKCKFTGKFNQIKFRSKKDIKQGFGFDKSSLEASSVFSRKQFKLYFSSFEDIAYELEGTRIVFENDRWFVILPQKRFVKLPDNQRLSQVALDPGVRTFLSFYSPEVSGKLGEGDFYRIYSLCCAIDGLISKMAKSTSRVKRRFKNARNRLSWKIKNLISELHNKVAYFLVTNFETIFIPTFETGQMVSKLRSKTARSMLTFAHFRFKSKLKAKAEEYSCKVVDVNEAYTSKTCSYCGTIQNIGGKKQFICQCGVSVDRDLNGGRGILLRSLLATTCQNS